MRFWNATRAFDVSMTTKASLFPPPDMKTSSYKHISHIIIQILMVQNCIWVFGFNVYWHFLNNFTKKKYGKQKCQKTCRLLWHQAETVKDGLYGLTGTGTGTSHSFGLASQCTQTILSFQYMLGVWWGRQESGWVGDSHTHTHTSTPKCPFTGVSLPLLHILLTIVLSFYVLSDLWFIGAELWHSGSCLPPTPTQQPWACGAQPVAEWSQSTQKQHSSVERVSFHRTHEVVSQGLFNANTQ